MPTLSSFGMARAPTQREIDEQAKYQALQRATALNNNTVQVTAAGSEAPPPSFGSLGDAQAAQDKYYQQHGTTDPGIEASITRMQNPDIDYDALNSAGETPFDPTQTDIAKTISANKGATNVFAGLKTKPPTSSVAKKSGREAEKAAINIQTRIQTGTAKNGTPIFSMVTDEAATQAARDALDQKFMEEDKMASDKQKQKEDLQKSSSGAPTTAQRSTGDTFTTRGIPEVKPPDFTSIDTHLDLGNTMVQQDPALAKGYIPELVNLQKQRTRIENDFKKSIADFDTQDKNNNGVTDSIESITKDSLKALEENKVKEDAIAKEVAQINLDAANLVKEMAEIGQKKFELQQKRNEQLVLDNNIEMERKNRLIANKLGIATGGNGLRWMQEEVRKGVDTLANLQESGSLQQAEFALKLGTEYNINVRSATNAYDAVRLQLNTQFSNDIKNLKSVVTLEAEERRKEKKSITKDYLDALDANDKTTYELIKDFNKTLNDGKSELKKMEQQEDRDRKRAEAAEDAADKRMRFQEAQQDKRLGITTSNQTRQQINTDRKMEKAEEKLVRTDFAKLYDSPTVKDYAKIRNSSDKATAVLTEAKKKGKIDLGVAKEVLGVLYEKALDPDSVVREGEYERAGLAQGIYKKAEAAIGILEGGDITLLSQDLINAFQQTIETMTKAQRESAQAEYAGAISRMVEFNSGSLYYDINPATITLPAGVSIPDWAAKTYFEDEEEKANDTSLDFDWHTSAGSTASGDPLSWVSEVGTGKIIGGSPFHKGIDKFAIDIDGRIGDPLPSPVGGTVTKVVESDEGYGNYVVVTDKDGYDHIFGHLQDFDIGEGDYIYPGSTIGRIGNTGKVIPGERGDGSHVHYRISKGNTGIDPQEYYASHSRQFAYAH